MVFYGTSGGESHHPVSRPSHGFLGTDCSWHRLTRAHSWSKSRVPPLWLSLLQGVAVPLNLGGVCLHKIPGNLGLLFILDEPGFLRPAGLSKSLWFSSHTPWLTNPASSEEICLCESWFFFFFLQPLALWSGRFTDQSCARWTLVHNHLTFRVRLLWKYSTPIL